MAINCLDTVSDLGLGMQPGLFALGNTIFHHICDTETGQNVLKTLLRESILKRQYAWGSWNRLGVCILDL